MEYKKAIHELKLLKESKPQIDSSQELNLLTINKRKDFNDQIRTL